MKTKEFILDDGMKLPPVGLGAYGLNGRERIKAIQCAVETGYHLLDSTFNYEDEGAVDEVVKTGYVPGSELIVTSKLLDRHQKYREALLTIKGSLYRGGLDYYNIYPTHRPNPKTGSYVEVWQAMIGAKKRGMIRPIGAYNSLPKHLEHLIEETGVTPNINQIELHPYFNQEEQRRWDAAHGVVDESQSPLGRANNILQDPVTGEIAKAHDKNISQIILHWHVQLGVLPTPKSSDPARQKENLKVFGFVLSEEEIQKIYALNRPDGRTADQDPSVHEEF